VENKGHENRYQFADVFDRYIPKRKETGEDSGEETGIYTSPALHDFSETWKQAFIDAGLMGFPPGNVSETNRFSETK